MHVVICGSGVVGACTAYFLSRRGIDVTVVERTEVAAAASGKAGGFLALDRETTLETSALGFDYIGLQRYPDTDKRSIIEQNRTSEGR